MCNFQKHQKAVDEVHNITNR